MPVTVGSQFEERNLWVINLIIYTYFQISVCIITVYFHLSFVFSFFDFDSPFGLVKIMQIIMCGSRKYPYSPHRMDWKFWGEGGASKTQKFKAMYEAEMEFPEGWEVIGKIPSIGGYGYFLEPPNGML